MSDCVHGRPLSCCATCAPVLERAYAGVPSLETAPTIPYLACDFCNLISPLDGKWKLGEVCSCQRGAFRLLPYLCETCHHGSPVEHCINKQCSRHGRNNDYLRAGVPEWSKMVDDHKRAADAGFARLCLTCREGFNGSDCPRCAPLDLADDIERIQVRVRQFASAVRALHVSLESTQRELEAARSCIALLEKELTPPDPSGMRPS